MSSLLLEELRRRSVRRKSRIRPFVWFSLAVFFALGIFVYSGMAWAWFRPVVHKHLINEYAGRYKIDPLWVMAIIKVESGFSSSARSHKGAVGLMQLLPGTARELAPEIGIALQNDEELLNPGTNLNIGVYYLTKLQAMFPEDELAVLSAYNAGPGITREWRQGKPALDFSDIAYPETRRFVKRVDQTYGWLKILQGWKHLFGIRYER